MGQYMIHLSVELQDLKTSHGFESFLNYLPDDLRIALSKFRCVYHKLPVEKREIWGDCKR